MSKKNTPITDRGVKKKSTKLAGKSIAMGICGGIGAVEMVKVARELRRHGAEVRAFVNDSVELFITDLSLEWATGHPVYHGSEASAYHLAPFDMVLVVPLTLNTLSKVALGLADSTVSLLVAGQLGRKQKVAMVPAMNEQLREHPLFDSYQARLEEWGVSFFPEKPEEGRLKVPNPEAVSEFVIHAFEN